MIMLYHLGINLRLYFRNTMALIYGYLFPTIFLVAFWVLYRYERVPLVRHMGELLTVTVLGGACFGLPTTMVSERERGVWRRYRLAPVSTGSLVASTVLARYFIIITAGLLQLALAMGVGMPLPKHPLELALAFTCVTFAFLGLGLVIAMLADNVPAVQALGQCIFLPMLIIGGVAVQLSSLPAWAQHLSAFFPGRYAVDAMQVCVTGSGLGPARFSLAALLVIGGAGCLAGSKMFRWDAGQRFATLGGVGWLAVALAAWGGVGLVAEMRGHIGVAIPAVVESRVVPAAATTTATGQPLSEPPVAPPPQPAATGAPTPPITPPAATTPSGAKPAAKGAPAPAPKTPVAAAEAPPNPADPTSVCRTNPTTWQAVTARDIDQGDLLFDNHLPPDSGVVTPIASNYEQPEDDVVEKLQVIADRIGDWKPGKVADPVQRVRNYLLVMSVPDVLQMQIERFVPVIVFDQIQESVPKGDLIKVLYWIACHPYDGDNQAMKDLPALGITNDPGDMEEVRNRAGIYSVKLLGRLIGKIQSK